MEKKPLGLLQVITVVVKMKKATYPLKMEVWSLVTLYHGYGIHFYPFEGWKLTL